MSKPQLYSPRQLPDLTDGEIVLEWDQEDAESVVRHDGREIWREWTGWEVYDAFERIAEVCRNAYGARLKDIVPSEASKWALFGDSTRASFVVDDARAALGAEPERKFYTLRELATAIRGDERETIREFLARWGDPNERESGNEISLLHLAAGLRRVAIVSMLLDAGAEPNRIDANGHSPLFEALDEPVRPGGGLVAGGFQMPAADRTPPPAVDASLEVVRLLLDAGARIDGLDRPIDELQGWAARMYAPPLALAARHMRNDAIEYLLARGADANAEDYGGMTALHTAAFAGNVVGARLLLDAGADPNRVCPANGFTPVHQALYAPEYDAKPYLVRLLASSGADVHQPTERGDPAIFGGASRLDLLELLVDLGVDVDGRDARGAGILTRVLRTLAPSDDPSPLVPRVELLLAKGADPAARGDDGKAPADVARERGWTSIVELLERPSGK